MSVVKLYYSGGTYEKWDLIPGRLIKVDNLADFLLTKTAMTINDFQQIKLALEATIKVDMSQKYSDPLVHPSFKYVSIQNTGEMTHYYFIKRANWRSLSCVEFELVLDVLNTFQEGTDYSFKENTRIVREHKDRFKAGNIVVHYVVEDLLDHNDYLSVGQEVWFEVRGETEEHFRGTLEGSTENSYTIRYPEADITLLRKFIYEHQGQVVITNGDEWVWYKSVVITDVDYSFYRLIDHIPEGINPVLQSGEGLGDAIEDRTPFNQHWHILYRNVNDPSDSEAANLSNPVECYLIPDKITEVKTGAITNGRLNFSSLEIGKAYFIPFDNNSAADIITLDDGTIIGSGYCAQYNDITALIVLYRNANNRIVVNVVVETTYTNTKTLSYESESITLHHLPLAYNKNDLPSLPDNFTSWKTLSDNGTYGSWTNASVTNVTDSIASLDRTDAKNIKLIKLPYCPYQFERSSGKIDISNDPNWSFASVPQSGGDCYCFKLNDLNVDLHRDITTYGMSKDGFYYMKVRDSASAIINASKTDGRIDGDLESKLYNSEFFQPTYFYDSFAFKTDLEKCDIDKFIADKIADQFTTIRFTMTKTINSKFSFSFTDYVTKLSQSNLPKIMTIARNNDEVLYNVSYLNYIRTGFNYDVKAKNLQNESNNWGIGISGGAMLASLLLPSIPLKVAGVVGSLASMASSIKGAVVANQSAENSIQSKLTQHRNQTDSVAGSDDVDLMSEYCGNRLRYLEYAPNPTMRNLLNDLFFYAGYRSDRMGVPDHYTRLNFDYLECEPSFEAISSIPEDCLKELANCFKAGVTYMHYNPNLTNHFDFDQSHENWERWLFS